MKYRFRLELLALFGGYGLLGALFTSAFCVARGAGNWELNLQSQWLRMLLAVAIVAGAASLVALVIAFRGVGGGRQKFWLPLLASFVVTATCIGFSEVAIRILAKPSPLGVSVGATTLRPYDWAALRQSNLALLERNKRPNAFYVIDEDLGWTLASGGTSENGLYRSSVERLRSRDVGQRLADREGARVALFGDSFAFSEEVSFEESLGFHLEQELGGNATVLNFGVPGYGIDQAVLRFQRDAPEWSPAVTVLTFIEDDLYRTANVYAFLKVDWDIPLSKPRFVVTGGSLELRNAPALAPELTLAASSIFDLPLLDHEIAFFAHDWVRHPLHSSYLIRYLVSRFPVWPTVNPLTSDDEIVAVSAELFATFDARARQIGSEPVIVYLPSSGNLTTELTRPLKTRVIAMLKERNVHVIDVTSCVDEHLDVKALHLPGGHYTTRGNMVVAECLQPTIFAALLRSTE